MLDCGGTTSGAWIGLSEPKDARRAPMARDRKPDVQVKIDRLARRHSQLSVQVAELERHLFLSPSEQQQVIELKKEKLAAKDALVDLKRGS